MMSLDFLPFEVLVGLFSYLHVGDLLVVASVSKLWRDAAVYLLAERATIMITNDANPAIETLMASSVPYQNWVFKEVDLPLDGEWGTWWQSAGGAVKSLGLHSTGLREKDFVSLLEPCTQLRALNLNGSRSLFREGTLLSSAEDAKKLSYSLKNVNRLHLACSRYLTDSLFSRITSVVGRLKKLSLAGCQISFQKAIHKRFYPSDGRIQISDHVLTFKHILEYIEHNSGTLKEISLGRTLVNSEALYELSKVPGLQLESLHLMSCDQLSKSGIQLLCENQKMITDLDLSLCSRVTDYAVLSVCQHLPHIKKLNLRRCQGITENGVRALCQLKHLEELNISHLESVTSESVDDALGKEARPTLRLLNLASLHLEWRTIERITTTAPNLTHLDVSMCITGVNDKSVQAICKSLTKLKYLNLNGCTPVTDIGLAGHGLGQQDPDLSGIGLSLESLGLKERDPFKVQLGSRAEKVIRQEAAVKKYLQENIEQIIKASEYGLSNLKGLQELSLGGCKRITDISLIYALKLQELHYLNLSHCVGVADRGLIALAQQCPSLEVLMLCQCSQTTDEVVLVISHYLKRIKTLDVQGCVMLTDDALDSLSSCQRLRYLDVSGCEKMSLEQVRLVMEKIPRLHDFHFRGIKEKIPDDEEHEMVANKTARIPTPPPLLKKIIKKF